MAWADLSQADKDKVSNLLKATREWAGMVARLGNLGRAIAQDYTGNVETVLGTLGSAELIPLNDSAQGQEQLTKSQLVDLIGYAITESVTTDAAPGSYNTDYHRAQYVRAAGLYNTLQQGG